MESVFEANLEHLINACELKKDDELRLIKSSDWYHGKHEETDEKVKVIEARKFDERIKVAVISSLEVRMSFMMPQHGVNDLTSEMGHFKFYFAKA